MSLDIGLYIEVDTGGSKPYSVDLYSANYTHNVTPMWGKAGVYDALYNSQGQLAESIIDILKAGIDDMVSKPSEYEELNPSNGWGSYESALPWLVKFYNACKEHPKAKISVWK